jgi:hypothetical protein
MSMMAKNQKQPPPDLDDEVIPGLTHRQYNGVKFTVVGLVIGVFLMWLFS